MRPLLLALSALVALTSAAWAEPVPEQDALRDGHSARLLTSGRLSFAARRANIESADVVLYKTYAFLDDETGRQTVDMLRQKALAGGRVYVEYDAKGTAHSIPSLAGIAIGATSAIPPYLRPLVDAGVVLIPTSVPKPSSPFLGRDHEKLLVTWKEGERARVIMGGMNIGNVYAWSGKGTDVRKPSIAFRDTDVELTGPEVESVMRSFIAAAASARSPHVDALTATASKIVATDRLVATPAMAKARVRFVRNDPRDGTGNRHIEKLYEDLIDGTPTGETVTLSNAYLLPPKRLRQAMIRAAARGVRFRMLINAPDVPQLQARTVAYAFRDQLRGLLKQIPEKQIEILEWSGNDLRNEGAIHQKIAKFGDKGPVLIGSANLDSLSANHNSESVVVLEDHRVGQQFDALINRSLREGKVRTIDQKALARDSLRVKMRGFFLNRMLGRFL